MCIGYLVFHLHLHFVYVFCYVSSGLAHKALQIAVNLARNTARATVVKALGQTGKQDAITLAGRTVELSGDRQIGVELEQSARPLCSFG